MTTKIEKALELGKVKGAKVLLAEYYNKQHKAEWTATKQAEYDSLFPMYRDMTEDEKSKYYNMIVTTTLLSPLTPYGDFKFPQTEIDYSQDENYVTFQEWLNETRVVSEAVEAVTEVDEEGVEVIVTPYQPEVTELVRPYVAMDEIQLDLMVEDYIRSKYATLRAKEYPPIEDYVDAIVKDDIDAIEEYKAKCLAVKAKYPKD